MTTINGVFQWLNQHFGLNIPLLPLSGFPFWIQALWKIAVSWQPPSPVEPSFRVPVNAPWSIPNGNGGQITLTILCIDVNIPPCVSPEDDD